MSVAAVILAAGSGSRFDGGGHKLRADLHGSPVLSWSVEAASAAGYDEVIIVVGNDDFSDVLEPSSSVVTCDRWDEGQSHSLRAAIDAAQISGHSAVVVGLADAPLVGVATWKALRLADASPIVVSTYSGRRQPPVRLDASVWELVPTSGDTGARQVISKNPQLVTEVASSGDPSDIDTKLALDNVRQSAADFEAVRLLIGREPMGPFEVVVRDNSDQPVVLKNYPILADGRPMPTLYWLCGREASMLVGRLESMKGVRRAEADLGLEVITRAHDVYGAERDAILDAAKATPPHRPSGGVGGTRAGVKCLHAHYGWWLAGGDDPVGQWVADHLHEVEGAEWQSRSNSSETR